MTTAIDVDALTPDDHVKTLADLATSLQAAGNWMNKLGPCEMGNLKLRRAAAVRWILAETAHGCDPKDLAG